MIENVSGNDTSWIKAGDGLDDNCLEHCVNLGTSHKQIKPETDMCSS
jgi:hypothetical protein